MTRLMDGVHVALVTPFDHEERINGDVLGRLVEDMFGNGVHGVVANGSTGEFPSLTAKERKTVVEIVAEASAGSGVLTVQVGAMTTREAVDHAEHAAQHGAQCLLLLSPYYEPLSEREVECYVRAVARVGLPIMIYNNPEATGWSMTTEFIARLAEIDEVKYVKDTTGDARRLFRVRELCNGSIEVINGQDSLALLGFLAGTRGTVWGAPNATPKQCLLLWKLTVESLNLPAASRLWEAFYPVNRFFEDEGYVAAVKAGTRLRGLDVGSPRRPILPLTADREAELERLLGQLEEVAAEVAGDLQLRTQ